MGSVFEVLLEVASLLLDVFPWGSDSREDRRRRKERRKARRNRR